MTGGKGTYETAYFIEKIDKVFDSLNVSSYTAAKLHRKPFQQPYRSGNDFRLFVSENYSMYLVYMFVKCLMFLVSQGGNLLFGPLEG